jgi:ubiquinone/menaquinone biosynthesis C-methylase UbiE
MGKSLFIAKQSGYPQGWFGHIVALVMARETATANRIALKHLDVHDGDAVLEVGFGHGQTVREIARRVLTARVSGVDPSEVMVRVARRKCSAYANRLDLRGGLAESLPFDDGVFDRALSVHTTYFWPRLEPGLREIRRVLRDRCRFVLGFRPADDKIAAANLPISVYTLHSIEDMKSALLLAGFRDVTMERTELKKGFISWAICS